MMLKIEKHKPSQLLLLLLLMKSLENAHIVKLFMHDIKLVQLMVADAIYFQNDQRLFGCWRRRSIINVKIQEMHALPHAQICNSAHGASQDLIRMFESQRRFISTYHAS